MAELSIGTVDVYVVRPLADGWRVLLLRRGAETRCPTSWEAVHGRLEPGEEPEDAALREVREETGLDAERLYSITVRPFYLYRNRTVQLACVFCAFVGEPAEVRLGDEHDSHAWLPVEDAMQRFAWPSEREAMREIVQLLGTGDAGALDDVLRVK